ncbi:MAG: hypothetical protein QOI70_482 [Microbacteriaceae bacterium]|jgi:hypothetical protein|nr:hypothetical protein [Microbacteriaceae bacterium]
MKDNPLHAMKPVHGEEPVLYGTTSADTLVGRPQPDENYNASGPPRPNANSNPPGKPQSDESDPTPTEPLEVLDDRLAVPADDRAE